MPFGQARTQGFADPVLDNFAAGGLIINSLGMFLYSSNVPAVGNLIYSNVNDPSPTHDKVGNYVFPGETIYDSVGGNIIATNIQAGATITYQYPNPATGPSLGFGNLSMQSGFNPITGAPSYQLFQSTAPYSADWFLYPSGDTTGATDSQNISSVLAGIQGTPFTVLLMPGTFYLNQPLTIPDQVSVRGYDPSWGIPTGNYGAGSLPLQGTIIQAGSAFAGAALITMGSVGTTQHGGQRLRGLTVSGAGAPANTHGIQSIGYVAGVKLEDIVVWGATNIQDGLHMANDGTPGHQADFWQVTRCKFSNCAGWGVSMVGVSDSWFTDTESTGNTLGGWTISGGADTRFIGCRADSNGSVPGWNLTPTSAGNVLSWTNCEANLNGTGWVFNGGSAATYCLSNCISHDNTTAIYSYTAGAAVRTDGGNFTVWVPLTPSGGWANSGVGPNAKYAWRGSSIEVIADMTAGTLTAGTGILSLPAAAFPAHAQSLVMKDLTTRSAQADINVGTGGGLTFFQAIGTVIAGDRCFLHGFISTDA